MLTKAPDAQKAAARKEAARYHAWQRRFWKQKLDRATSPQANWRDVGQELRKIFIERGGQRCTCYWCRVYQDTPHGQRENYWIVVVSEALSGDPSALVKHLRSPRLTRLDRNMLAETLEDILTGHPLTEQTEQTKQRGRPKRKWVRRCADVAIKFYQDWKDANRRNGINDWGHRDEMKDEASRLAIELYGNSDSAWARIYIGHDPPTFEQVRELMERPVARRR